MIQRCCISVSPRQFEKRNREQVTFTDRWLACILLCFCRKCESMERMVSISSCTFRRDVARWGCVGECYLWTQTVSEARVALARKPQTVENGCRAITRWGCVGECRFWTHCVRGVVRWGCVGECRLWTQDVSEARVAPARGPRDLGLYNRKLWRPTDAKNHVRTVSNPILFRHVQ